MSFAIRLMREDDIPAIMRIQAQAYNEFTQESQEVILARLRQVPDLAFVAEDAQGVCGYLFSYRSTLGAITPLDAVFDPANDPDCLYLHDLAVATRAGGRGIGPALVKRKLSLAAQDKLPYSALVSVQGSAPFWARMGYHICHNLTDQQQQILATYDGPAVYMTRDLAAANQPA